MVTFADYLINKMYSSKIRLFLIIGILFIISSGCHKKSDIIPDVVVDFTIDINDPRFVQLNAIGESITVNTSTNNERYAGGYNGSGIIVTRGVDEFYAYDRTCPHEYSIDKSVNVVNIDQNAFAKAVCPKCKTVYELISFGTPSSGIGRYPLKNYKTFFDGRYLRVWNE